MELPAICPQDISYSKCLQDNTIDYNITKSLSGDFLTSKLRQFSSYFADEAGQQNWASAATVPLGTINRLQ